jgi:hypothetical protein
MEVGMVLGLMGTLMLSGNVNEPANSICFSREAIDGLSGGMHLPFHFPADALGICYNFIADVEYDRSNTGDTSNTNSSSVEIANAMPKNALNAEFGRGTAAQTHMSEGQRWGSDAELSTTGADEAELWEHGFIVASLCVMIPFLAFYTFAFWQGGNERPELSVREVASLTGPFQRHVRLGVRELSLRGQIRMARVDSTDVVVDCLPMLDGWAVPFAIRGCFLSWLPTLPRHRLAQESHFLSCWGFVGSCFVGAGLSLPAVALSLCSNVLRVGNGGLWLAIYVTVFIPIIVSVPAVRDVCFGRWAFVAAAGAIAVMVGGSVRMIMHVFGVVLVLWVQLASTLILPEGVRAVAGTRRWVQQMQGLELSEEEREEVLLYAEAAGMSRRFIRNFPSASRPLRACPCE